MYSDSFYEFGQRFKAKRKEEAQRTLEVMEHELRMAQRDFDLFNTCIIESAINPTPARIKQFLRGKIQESPIYGGNKNKGDIAKCLSAQFLSPPTWGDKYITTIYRPKGGKERALKFRYDNRYKILINETERIVLVFSKVTHINPLDDIPPF